MSFESPLGSHPLSHEAEGPAEHEPPATGDTVTPATQDKPIRLALACNQCRKRKVRCDAQHPKCRNCSIRGDVCETSDPRKPGNFPAVRRRATRCCPKARGGIAKILSHPLAHHSISALKPAALNSINAVLNPAGPGPGSLVDQSSPNARRSSRSSAAVGSSASPTPSWRTTQSDRLGEDHFSWQSRAYQEEADAAQGQEIVREHDAVELARVVTPEEDVNTDDNTNDRAKHLGASSVQCLFNFIDLHLERHGFSHVTPLFKHGMLHTEEFPMPLMPRLPLLPDRQNLSNYVDAFFSRLWLLFPVIDRSSFEADIETIIALQEAGPETWQQRVTLAHAPALVSVYAVISLSMNEISGNSESSFDYLTASHSLHGHLTAIPYLPSVQALFLLALALRAIAKDGQAWHLIGHAIRIAQSIGLQKSTTRDSSAEGFTLGLQPETLRERLWWSLFGLEKLMQLECGRASILDRSYDSLTVKYPGTADPNHGIPYFRAWIALTSIMGRISTRLYSHKFMGGSAEMLGVVAELDQELLEWESSLPDTLKPGKALTEHTGNEHQILATFLSQQYYHAQLSILRVAVIFPQRSIKHEIFKNIHNPHLPTHTRLLDGALICANAARAIITQSLQLADSGLNSTLLSVSPTYLAAVILALGVLRQPSSRLVRSDIELLCSATELVEAWFLGRGFSEAFTQTCGLLRERVVAVFQRVGQRGSGSSGSIEPGSRNSGGQHVAGAGGEQSSLVAGRSSLVGIGAAVSSMENQHQLQHQHQQQDMDVFGGFEFEDLWNLTGLDFMVYDEENPLFAQ